MSRPWLSVATEDEEVSRGADGDTDPTEEGGHRGIARRA